MQNLFYDEDLSKYENLCLEFYNSEECSYYPECQAIKYDSDFVVIYTPEAAIAFKQQDIKSVSLTNKSESSVDDLPF